MSFLSTKKAGIAFGFCLLVVLGQLVLFADDDCNLALDAPSDAQPCKQDDTPGSCPGDCSGTSGTNGTDFSGNTVMSHVTTGSSKAAASNQVECSRPKKCTNEPKDDQSCFTVVTDDGITHECMQNLGESCPSWSVTLGNWNKAPSANIDSCDG